MRLGGPIMEKTADPQEWVAAHRREGYTAAYSPELKLGQSDEIAAYRKAAADAELVIAEVGAWSNPISPDDEARRSAIRYCQERLALAEEIGARCCVNIAGSRGAKWDGPHPANLSDDTFALIVDTVREIVDAVRPVNAFYTLETMPWVFPDTADNYLKLIEAIDRPGFAVHLDPVNLITSPRDFYFNGDIIRESFRKLGPYVKSCHAKDLELTDELTVHLGERRPGLGGIDYRTYLSELGKLDKHIPLMLEHLPTAEEYKLAAGYVRSLQAELEGR
ncbi:sugar phosphate isomerase/epimerase family protein [Paenibacillus sacheonensis]|uniref:TIM barrel protein n=1 Tax=Paenibacillus sacheonensis TaxID=742054 RepID=A0A7X4YVP5_9BACL|nr:sugar phosphate isomerase/epimerase [Paenibacillus sacheonensis]MBM7568665.1 sugar phosphate isomerase/epimerase [Paenibacillus sacheonensis]NBC72444.1 TIM barrel protein [Paenibacillus sacheonensis]